MFNFILLFTKYEVIIFPKRQNRFQIGCNGGGGVDLDQRSIREP